MKGQRLVAHNLRKLRVRQDLSQGNLALDAGIDRTYVSRLERGIENPTVAVLEKGRKAPFDPASVVIEFAEIVKRYSIRRASADRYAGEWVTASFKTHGITIEAAERSKSEIYLEAEPLFAQGAI